MQRTVLLSIKPEFAEKILNGQKNFEFRRTIFRDATVAKVIIYASSPVCRVIGEFDVEGVLSMSMHALWRRTRKQAGISWLVFSEYFEGKEECHAIMVANPMRYPEPKALIEAVGLSRPPQSFTYVNCIGRELLQVHGRSACRSTAPLFASTAHQPSTGA